MNKLLRDTLTAVLFAVGEPITPERLAETLGEELGTILGSLQDLQDALAAEDGALRLIRLGDAYQLATNERFAPAIRSVLIERRNMPLSQAALEVLAAIAYNQPVTKGYIEQVRGVDSASIVNALVEKGLIEEAGRLDLPGRPVSYQTTAHFLRTFGLSTLEELPTTDAADVLAGQLALELE